jgi:hypothetical protein
MRRTINYYASSYACAVQLHRWPEGALTVFICSHGPLPWTHRCVPLDASVPNARRDLFEAMKQVAETGHGPREQFASMGSLI